MAKWIDADYANKVGDLLFLVESFDTSNGRTRWVAQNRPLHTNQSHEPRLFGWCGETNNRSLAAHGVVRIARVASRTERMQVVSLRGDELAAALESLGYPELTPDH